MSHFLGQKLKSEAAQAVPGQDPEASGLHAAQEFFPLHCAECLEPGESEAGPSPRMGALPSSFLVCPSQCLKMAQTGSCWWPARRKQKLALGFM